MRKVLVVVGMLAAMGILYACGGSSSKSSSGGGSGTTTTVAAPAISTAATITTQADAAKTVNSAKTLASSFASGSSFPSIGSLVAKPAIAQAANSHRIIDTVHNLQQKVAGLIEKQKVLGKQVAAVQSQACSDSGTMSFDTASNPLVITFTACKQGTEYMNGTVSMPQALMGSTSGSGTLTANLTTINYSTGGSKTNESVINMTMTIAAFSTSAASLSENMSINGTETNVDYLHNTSDKQSFGNFSLNMTENTSGTSTTTNMTLNGSVSMDTFSDTTFTTIDTASGMTFQNLALSDTYDSSTLVDVLTVNGTYAIKTIPACMDGTFVISTQTALTTTGSGVTTGEITVNGVDMIFNANGTVTATINGTPQTITSYANACSLSF